MILDAISLLDCAVFVIFLVPQLFYQAGVFQTLAVVVQTVPFLSQSLVLALSTLFVNVEAVFVLPFQLCHERYFKRKDAQSPFVQNASLFQDIVIRCVRFAFANIPASIGRVFFSKWVAHPFFRFRLLRHGYLKCPISYQEVQRPGLKGIWATFDSGLEPDIIIYYCHGGGFSMGSSYFYLEFLMAWATCLKEQGFQNPAIFALEYTLVPDAKWPTQFKETRNGYKFLLDSFGSDIASKICVSGDSAGATLILSMLLHPGPIEQEPQFESTARPGLAVLLSPWTHLVSELNQNTASDYLDNKSLHLYARQYAGDSTKFDGEISPGLSRGRWSRSSPRGGYCITYGEEEVFAPGIQELVRHMKTDGASVQLHTQPAGIHAWPVVDLFLGETRKERLRGLKIITDFITTSSIASKGKKLK